MTLNQPHSSLNNQFDRPPTRTSRPASLGGGSSGANTEKAAQALRDATIWKVALEAVICLFTTICFLILSWWSYLNTVDFSIPLTGTAAVLVGGMAFNLSQVFGFAVQYTPNILVMAKTIRPNGTSSNERGQSEIRRYVMLLNIGIILFSVVDFISNVGYYWYTIKPSQLPPNIAPIWYDLMAIIVAALATQLEEAAIFVFGLFLNRAKWVYDKATKGGHFLPNSL